MKAIWPRLWLPRCMVEVAGMLVPRSQREDWRREWHAELWHICLASAERHSLTRREIVGIAAGCFPDAWCLRSDRVEAPQRLNFHVPSAGRCTALLAAWALAGLIACGILPGSRQAMVSLFHRSADDLVMLSAGRFAGTQVPTIRLATWQVWKSETQNLFSEIAFYRISTRRVHLPGSPAAHITLALGTPNLLDVLQEDRVEAFSGTSGEAQLYLTRTTWLAMEARWKRGSDVVEVAGRTVHLAGILDDEWHLPGQAQGVLLDSPRMLMDLPGSTRGFVLARLRPAEARRLHGGWMYLLDRTGNREKDYLCVRQSNLESKPISVFLLALLLAALALPATTPLQLGEYPRTSCRLAFSAHLRRWGFLGAKFLLATAVVFWWSIALAYGMGTKSLPTSIYLQLATGFPALLFLFRWILHDQRNRCPHCLRLLSNPARVGQPSCNFLSWNGTELICTVGHGLMHIPELPTSWCSTQRWLSLDSSWLSLFHEGGPAVAEGT